MVVYRYILSPKTHSVNKKKGIAMPTKTDLWTYLSKSDKTIVMYGMGNGADKILAICSRYSIEVSDFFASDGFVRGHLFHGKRVLSYSEAKEKYGAENMIVLLSFASSLPEVLENIYRIADECELYAPDVPVCGTTLFDSQLFEQNKDKIELVSSLLADEKSKEVYNSVVNYKLSGDIAYIKSTHSDFAEVYRDILKAEDFETVADLGAYNGDTLREIKPFAPKLKTAIAFEPDRRNHKKLCDYAQNETFYIEAHQTAAWSHKDTLFFDGSGNRNSTLTSSDSLPVTKGAKIVEADADSLDSILADRRIDYIKYDVEGSEREAVEGSKTAIERHRPALLISLYHRSEDIYELPLLIHERYPDYKLYIRRREYIPAWDTVLIAVKN
ncbi:MAG: FkbM family methyltransferase [Ruminococcaceae bacterium]|nr:FkbM family methyltransferase [Oscillospiraceae bacterium]